MVKNILLASLIVFFVCSLQVYAEFVGPADHIKTTFGIGDGQVGFEPGDTEDVFAWRFAVSPTGKIAIFDEVNERVIIFDNKANFERNINRLATNAVFDKDDSIYLEAKFRKYDKNGSMIFEKNVGYDEVLITLNDKVIGHDREKGTYTIYSLMGEVTETTNDRPLELGRVEERSLGSGKYKTTITYDDAIYTINSNKEYDRFIRDKNKNVYGILPALVEKFGQCGTLLGRLELPDPLVFKGDKVPGEEQYIFEHDRYGEPVFDVNGNVYTWKATPNNYSILKWTWQDDPNAPADVPDAPTNLTVAAGATGLTLRWKAPLQDPGCVSEYEIARSTVAQGAFTPIGTAPSGTFTYTDTTAEAGLTYYYKVRAKGGSGYSDYTNEASGVRQ